MTVDLERKMILPIRPRIIIVIEIRFCVERRKRDGAVISTDVPAELLGGLGILGGQIRSMAIQQRPQRFGRLLKLRQSHAPVLPARFKPSSPHLSSPGQGPAVPAFHVHRIKIMGWAPSGTVADQRQTEPRRLAHLPLQTRAAAALFGRADVSEVDRNRGRKGHARKCERTGSHQTPPADKTLRTDGIPATRGRCQS